MAGTPLIERSLTKEELKTELFSVIKTRKIIMRAVWAIAIGVMIYGMANVTPFLIEHGVSKFIAPGLPLIVDTALCVSLWGDRVLRKYSLKDGWLTTLRWSTGIMTWLLNITSSLAGPQDATHWTPDWIGVGVHSCGPIMLILVTEAASSFSRKATKIIQSLTKVEDDESAISNERQRLIADLERELKETKASLTKSTIGGEQMKSEYDEDKLKFEKSKNGAERVSDLILSSRPSHETSTLMGRSVIEQFGGFNQLAPLLNGTSIPSTELGSIMGNRVVVYSTSTDSIVVTDMANPNIQVSIEGIKTSDIPAKALVAIRDSDLGFEMVNMLREKGALNEEERGLLVQALVDGDCRNLSNAFLTRVLIRCGMESGRIRDTY